MNPTLLHTPSGIFGVFTQPHEALSDELTEFNVLAAEEYTATGNLQACRGVVPVLTELAAHLPALRSASSTKEARQLQSSSHRGICSIQRALTSISEMKQADAVPALTLLRDASRQGAFLREVVSRNS